MTRLLKKLLMFFPLLAVMASFNVIFDPAGLFTGKTFENAMARHLLLGHNLATSPNFDDRYLQKLLIGGRRQPPDIAVFGSSRSMEIAFGSFPGSLFANNSVTESCLHDFLALYQIYRETGALPKKLLIGIDAWIFNLNLRCHNWQSLGREHKTIMEVLVPDETFGLEFTEWLNYCPPCEALFSPPYFQAALHNAVDYANGREKSRRFEVVSSEISDNYLIRPDGSYIFGRSVRDNTPQEIGKSVRGDASNYRHARFYNMDGTLTAIFEAFLDLLARENVEVIFFLPPYHPDAIPPRSRFERIVGSVESYLRETARTRGVKVIGSYFADKAGVAAGDFYDAHHLRKQSLARIVASGI